VQAVRLLVQWLRRNGVPQEHALLHVLRFQNSLSLSFPASQIEALWIEADVALHSAGALDAALRDGRLAHIHITPAFMGFLGSTGVLPNHYTERIAAEQQTLRSDSGRAFFDTFSHRVLTLYFQTWQKYRLEQGLDTEGEDGLLPLVLAFGGPKDLNVRVPSGNESGANELWIPGGKLPTGQLEATVNAIPEGKYVDNPLWH
jgi:type VI secretion system protein ImpH